MMKRVKLFFTAICVWIGMMAVIHSSAQEIYVYDDANLLSAEETSALQQRAEEFHKSWGMNVLVVTAIDAQGKSSMEYADDFYDARFPDAAEEDGMLYLIDMDNREIYLSTCGEAIRYMTDQRIHRVLDLVYEEVVEENYANAFWTFFDSTEAYFQQGIAANQYNAEVKIDKKPKITLMEMFIALVAAVVAAGGTMGVIKAKYQLKFEDFHYDAYTDAEVDLAVKSDHLVNKLVTHRRIPKNNGNPGGGGRSSVHHASSGRSHGGGGRKF